MNKFLKLIFGDPNEKLLKSYYQEIAKINELEQNFKDLSDQELAGQTEKFQARLAEGETLEDIAFEAFATVREASRRTLNQRHYDVQLIGGLALHRGLIAEMRTGEGKTLTSTLPIYLNALNGEGVHVVTVNDYLAKRDAVWMGQIFHFLGLTLGVIQQEGGYLYDESFKANEDLDELRDETGGFAVQMDFLRPASRKDAYSADITYGTNNQFGFDYLRDNMAGHKDQVVQRGLKYAIIDEIDSILIDEARTPLIISAPAEESADLYLKFAKIARSLKEDEDYNLDEKMRVATFTDEGLSKVEKALGVENLYAEGGMKLVHHAEQALRAQAVFRKDKDYVIQDGEIKIVDEFTGRIMEGRRYSEGLHQALEAKENVEVKRESQTLATITFQNFFRMYEKLAGMTGTAETESEEFAKIYQLEVLVIPTNKPIARIDQNDAIFKSEEGKMKALTREVAARQEKGQPVLIGTASIEKNELVSHMLSQAGIRHEVLNAKNHEREAQIIAQAGLRGAVTVATNMAGRGVDIKLGGNPGTQESYQEICDLGGLCVIGTERHESRRIDNQLRGRAGRQGDPGFTQFFVSMEDDLMRIFGGERMKSVMQNLGVEDDQPIESKMISSSLEKAQARVEGQNFDSRKRVLDYDEVLNKHRINIYERRARMINDDEYSALEELAGMVENEVEKVILFHTGDSAEIISAVDELPNQVKRGDWDPKEIIETLDTIIPLTEELQASLQITLKDLSKNKEVLVQQRTDTLEKFMEHLRITINDAKENLGHENAEGLARSIVLRSMDQAWVEHLETMQYLRRSIGLRGYGQRDPLVEYNREAFHVFNDMNAQIERRIVYSALKILRQASEARVVADDQPGIFDRANLNLQGAQKTMENQASQSRASRRAAARLLNNPNSKIPSQAKRAKLRKKRRK